ncbi:MAG: formate--tetrahydrofolate ligase [Planctomycetes bacterium]|nr:formate--tetrahydrofolate ligase [Planctomycetota bacterium]
MYRVRSIEEVAAELGLFAQDWFHWGPGMAKVDPNVLKRSRSRAGQAKLVLVSAMTPTPAGEGKTTTAIGLAQGLAQLGLSSCLALREPSLGPCFGMKGGGTGGGRSALHPADRINLHFTGDLHAVTSAHALLSALLDNHLFHGNERNIDPKRILWPRVVDMNDRALRRIVCGLGGPGDGVSHESGFDITAASEIMAALCLAEDASDLRERLGDLLVAFDRQGNPIRAHDLKATGAMLVLLRDALMPNLVQSTEGVPAFVHGGPFANIAHGCNSLIATRLAMHLADWVITEAGFGFDLGAEKFFDILCNQAGLDTAAVVLVATVRALRWHGGLRKDALDRPNVDAVERGLANLEKHVENIRQFGESPVVALNHFPGDLGDEVALVRERCVQWGVPFAVSEHFEHGGSGAIALAETLLEHAEREPSPFHPLYVPEDSVLTKIERVAQLMYGANSIELSRRARTDLSNVERLGGARFPVCIAKTPASLTDDPHELGRPRDFPLHVERILIQSGARFLVVLTGDILRMPGFPKHPRAEIMDLVDGEIVGW